MALARFGFVPFFDWVGSKRLPIGMGRTATWDHLLGFSIGCSIDFLLQGDENRDDRVLASPEQIDIDVTAGGDGDPCPPIRCFRRPLACKEAGQQVFLEPGGFPRWKDWSDALAAVVRDDAGELSVRSGQGCYLIC